MDVTRPSRLVFDYQAGTAWLHLLPLVSGLTPVVLKKRYGYRMDFKDFAFIFNRALEFSFSKKKLFLVFCILALSGLLIVFFQGIALNAGHWVQLSLTFLPIFICTGICLSLGVFLIRIYHDEVKQRQVNYWEVFGRSWEMILGASYFAIPIIVSYLLLWILLGIFIILQEIPAIGEAFSIVLAFAPFLINLAALALCVMGLILLFVVTPLIALKGLKRESIFHMTIERLSKEPFANLTLLIISLIPVILVIILLSVAIHLTNTVDLESQTAVKMTLRWFFTMLPLAALITPAVIFFFNYAAEAHVLIQKQIRG